MRQGTTARLASYSCEYTAVNKALNHSYQKNFIIPPFFPFHFLHNQHESTYLRSTVHPLHFIG